MAWWRFALWAAVVTAALIFLWSVRSVLLPFGVGWIIAVLLEPLVKRMTGWGMNRVVAILAIVSVFFVVATGVGLWVGPRIGGQVGELQKSIHELTTTISQESRTENHFLRWNPVVRSQPPGPLAALDRTLEQVSPALERAGLPSNRRAIFEQYVAPQRDQIAEGIGGFFNGFFKILIGAASQMFLFVFVPLFVFFFLMDMENYAGKMIRLVPPAIQATVLGVVTDVGQVFKSYLRGVLVNVAIYTTFFALVFSALGLPYSILLGLLAGTLYLIPVLGGVLTSVSLFLVVGFSGTMGNWFFTVGSSWTWGLIVAILFSIISTGYDSVVTPRLVGKAVGLDPLVSMFVVFSGGALFGLPGMILAYPVSGALKVTMSRIFKVTNMTPASETLALPVVPARHRESIEP